MDSAVADVVREQAPSPEASPRKLREHFGPLVQVINERSRSAYAYADKQLRAHPWGSAGAIFGLGVVFGALIAMAARRR